MLQLKEATPSLIQPLTALVNRLVNSPLTKPERDLIFATAITPLVKKPGDPTPRPIQVQSFAVRLAGRVVHEHTLGAAAEYLQPFQVAVGTRMALEAGVRAVRSFKESVPDPGRVRYFTMDVRSAFQFISRAHIITAGFARFPSLAFWLRNSFADATQALFDGDVFEQAEGGAQGRADFMMWFCVAMQRLLEVLRERCRGQLLFQLLWADGGIFAAYEENVETVLSVMLDTLIELNLSPNWGKTLISAYCPLSDDFVRRYGGQPRAIDPEKEVLEFAGVPVVYSNAAFLLWQRSFLAEYEALLEKIVALEDAHCAYRLLSSTTGICKVMHLMRTLPVTDDDADGPFPGMRAFYRRLDGLSQSAFARITGFTPTPTDLLQIGLPQRLGGLGLLSCSDNADACYVAASIHSASMVARMLQLEGRRWVDPHLEAPLQRFNAAVADGERLAPADQIDSKALKQHDLLVKLANRRLDELQRQRPSARDRARLLALRQQHSIIVALNAPPNPRRNMHLSNLQLRYAIAYILGFLPHTGEECQLCGAVLDEDGFHATAQCVRGRAKKLRHDQATRVISRQAERAGHNVAHERALLPTTTNPYREADVLVNFRRDPPLSVAYDVSIVSPLQHTHITQAATNASHVHTVTDAAKRRKYRVSIEAAQQRGIEFATLVADTYGSWSREAHNFFRQIIREAAILSEEDVWRESAAFYQRLAMTLLKQLTWAIIDRRPIRLPGP